MRNRQRDIERERERENHTQSQRATHHVRELEADSGQDVERVVKLEVRAQNVCERVSRKDIAPLFLSLSLSLSLSGLSCCLSLSLSLSLRSLLRPAARSATPSDLSPLLEYLSHLGSLSLSLLSLYLSIAISLLRSRSFRRPDQGGRMRRIVEGNREQRSR